ncbi:MAG: ribonuclease III [Bacteroidales bacterium]|nr:ribonuclease III [Bacteroidales bacterium]
MFNGIISFIRLLSSKDKGLYVFIHDLTGFYPKDINLYKLAFVHRSKPVKDEQGNWVNNERLEYLGDAVLDLVVASYLYHHYPEKHEGFLTSTRAKIVQRESLNRIGKLLRLEQHVKASSHSSSHNSYIAGNAVEAFVGAIYLDRGYAVAQKFIENKIIREHIDIVSLVNTEKNFKSRLIEWTQKFHVGIEYELVDTYCDAENNPVFRTAVLLGGIYAADATGYSKKESHQGASKKALERLKTDHIFYEQVVATATTPTEQ